MGTQTKIAQTIVEAQADYVLSVKENQGHLYGFLIIQKKGW
jgi:predicted transposase YbfD/YdcC